MLPQVTDKLTQLQDYTRSIKEEYEGRIQQLHEALESEMSASGQHSAEVPVCDKDRQSVCVRARVCVEMAICITSGP